MNNEKTQVLFNEVSLLVDEMKNSSHGLKKALGAASSLQNNNENSSNLELKKLITELSNKKPTKQAESPVIIISVTVTIICALLGLFVGFYVFHNYQKSAYEQKITDALNTQKSTYEQRFNIKIYDDAMVLPKNLYLVKKTSKDGLEYIPKK